MCPGLRVSDFFCTRFRRETGEDFFTSTAFDSAFDDHVEVEVPTATIVNHRIVANDFSGHQIMEALIASVGAGNEQMRMTYLKELIVNDRLGKDRWYLMFVPDKDGKIRVVCCIWCRGRITLDVCPLTDHFSVGQTVLSVILHHRSSPLSVN
jgi:hypothetical protein